MQYSFLEVAMQKKKNFWSDVDVDYREEMHYSSEDGDLRISRSVTFKQARLERKLDDSSN